MNQQKMLRALEKALRDFRTQAEAGDERAHIALAMGEALREYMLAGGKLTDMDWFKGTTHYTGERAPLQKAA